MTRHPARSPLLVALFLIGMLAADVQGQDLSSDLFAAQVLGDWEGEGVYDGNSLRLTRYWTTELHGRFLRADMKVEMQNGFTFGAIMYWKVLMPGLYEVVWMDGTGRVQQIQATRDSVSGVVTSTFLDRFAENGPEWRSWEFESLGADSYVERLYKIAEGGREKLATFFFERFQVVK